MGEYKDGVGFVGDGDFWPEYRLIVSTASGFFGTEVQSLVVQ